MDPAAQHSTGNRNENRHENRATLHFDKIVE